MRRIAIIGPGGAGKTTLAAALADRLGIEVVQLDRLFWRPGWVKTTPDETEELQRAALSRDSWIVDSGSPRALRSRLEAADTIVFLDLPPLLCALRAFRRRLRTRGQSRAELPAGCAPSRLDRAVIRYFGYVRHYRRELRPLFLRELERLGGERRVVLLRDSHQLQSFLASVPGREPDASRHALPSVHTELDP